MKRRRVEDDPIDRAAITRLTAPQRAQSGDNGIASRVRRDAKNALEQRPAAVACGEHPMIAVPVLGRAVRIYKGWYALCSYCGALARVQPHLHRYGAELCCLRCDQSMLRAAPDAPSALGRPSDAPVKACRFCGVVWQGNASGWKEAKAPLDVAGPNAVLPPPLRRVWYCRQHFRGWVPQAHRVMQTRFILSHLVHNAKPIFGADESSSATATKSKARPRTAKPKRKRR